MHVSGIIASVLLFVGYCAGRAITDDYDPNLIPRSEDEAAVTEEFNMPQTSPPYEEEIPDSCDDFPPASCIRHFQPLPRNLARDPFALRNEKEFTVVCDAYKQSLQCFADYSSRCLSNRPDSRMFINQMIELLNQCENPQIIQDSLAALDCGRRMSSVHERCMRETRFIPQLKNLSSARLIQGEPDSLRDLCCGMRYHRTCYMDQVQERCGAPAYAANQRLEGVIMSGFNCDSVSTADCPAIRP